MEGWKVLLIVLAIIILIVVTLFLLQHFNLLDISRLTTIPSSGKASGGGLG